MHTSIDLFMAAAICAAPLQAQGTYKIQVGPIQAKVVLASLPGNPVLDATTGDPIPGLTWRKLDADVDGLADDIRLESGPGKLDLRDGAAGSGINGGTCRDGNVPYPNNEIPNSAWIR
jgi:hypothetical protein